MLFKKKHIVLVALIIGLLGMPAYSITPEEILAQVKTNLDKIKTIQAYYIQKMSNSLSGPEPRIESGLFYKDGKKFRKDIQRPESKLIISNDTMYYDKNNVTGTLKTHVVDEKALKNPFMGVSPEDVLKKYSYSLKSETTENYKLDGKYESTRIFVEIDKKEGLPRKLTVYMNNKPYMFISMIYTPIKGIQVLQKVESKIQLEGGNRGEINISLDYQDIKLNEGINSDLFVIPQQP